MEVRIMVFGQLTDIIKKSEVKLTDVADTNTLVEELKRLYPGLATSRFVIAVNKQTIKENVSLNDGSVVALLPPFSGG